MRPKGRPRTYYAYYLGDTCVAHDYGKELAEKLGISLSTLQYYATKTYKRLRQAEPYEKQIHVITVKEVR